MSPGVKLYIYSEGGPSMYFILCVIAVPCVRSVGCVFTHVYTLFDDLECLEL